MNKQSLKTILGRASFKNRDRYDLEKHINGAYDKVKEFIGDNPDFDSLQKVINAIDDTNLVQIGDYDSKLIQNTIELINKTNAELSKTVGTVFIKNDSIIGGSSRGNILKVARNPNNKNSIIVDIFSGGNYNEIKERIITYTFTLSGNSIICTNNKIINISSPLIEITYSELKSLRDNSQLIPGQQYKIIDYQCTTTQTDTQSANHPFDIIVTADSTNKLNCKVRASLHSEDTYFVNSQLDKWELWYDIDNDTTKYNWADESNGKGVIYRMIDEFNNDAPYDFKNIQFRRYILDPNDAVETDAAIGGELDIVKQKLQKISHKIHTSLWYYGEYISGVYPNADVQAKYVPFGDIYYDIAGPQVLCKINENNFGWYFTFTNEGGGDASLTGQDKIYDNTIKSNHYLYEVDDGTGSYIDIKSFACLNDMIFYGNNCYANSFGNDCYSNSFGNNCSSNSFGNNCFSNSFGNNCSSNSFGKNCFSNSFGNNCSSNSFGNNCSSNAFGNDCSSNAFGNDCYSNSFGNDCSSNAFGNNCYANSFGNYCSSNSFGNDCLAILFASDRSLLMRYNYFRNNHFEDGCQYILFTGIESASSSLQVQNYHFSKGLNFKKGQYITVDGKRNRDFETKVAKNSDGELKIYCEADLIK